MRGALIDFYMTEHLLSAIDSSHCFFFEEQIKVAGFALPV